MVVVPLFFVGRGGGGSGSRCGSLPFELLAVAGGGWLGLYGVGWVGIAAT